MAVLTAEMQRLVNDQKLGFVATVSSEGRPNLSPKGTLAVWDEHHLIFADISSPHTVANVRRHPFVEVNVVDPFARKGFRFRGTATVIESGEEWARALQFFTKMGVQRADERVRAAVVIKVEQALPLVSPLYRTGGPTPTETEVRRRWKQYYERLDHGESGLPDPV